MSNEKEKTALDYYSKKIMKLMMYAITKSITGNQFSMLEIKLFQESKEMEKEQMRSYIEEKWKQYRIVTNEEDAWLFKEWLIKQTYGGNK
jgi:hypothetical protein